MKIYSLIILTILLFFSTTLFFGTEKKYNRDNWFHWNKDVFGCKNTRHTLLERTSLAPVTYYSDKKCKVKTGKWYDPYTNKIFFNSSMVDIDHIVPLSWAATHGGINWNKKKKRQFANDIDNLIPVSRSENKKKGGLGPNEYLPPNKDFHCNYIKKFENIVFKYKLTYNRKEHNSLKALIESCP
jgi:hypothetical protein